MTERKIYFLHLLGVTLICGLTQAQTAQPASQQNPFQCHVTHLPTSWEFYSPPGAIENNNAQFADIGDATLDLRFRNSEAAPIQALSLVVEYIDADEKVIVRVPMFAQVNPAVAKIPPNQFKPADAWGSPLAPGDAGLMVGDELGMRTGRCPVRARVTFARVHFADGSVRTYSSPDWRLGPSPYMVPRLPDTVPELPVQAPVSLLAKIKIGASGTVLDVVAEEPADPRLVGWIRDRIMQDWKFHPALLNGNPGDSELTALFLINAKGMTKFVESKPILRPITLIRFVWAHDLSAQMSGADRLTVMYGLWPEGTILDLQFQNLLSQVHPAAGIDYNAR